MPVFLSCLTSWHFKNQVPVFCCVTDEVLEYWASNSVVPRSSVFLLHGFATSGQFLEMRVALQQNVLYFESKQQKVVSLTDDTP